MTIEQLAMLMAQVAALTQKADEVRALIAERYHAPHSVRVVIHDPKLYRAPSMEVRLTSGYGIPLEVDAALAAFPGISFDFVYVEEDDL